MVNNQKGVSLYLTIVIMSIILGIVFGISAILLIQLKTIKGIENSVIAFYAADAGIEKVLMERLDPTVLDGDAEALGNGASFEITVLASGAGGCTAANFCIKSVGNYRDSRRAIKVEY